MVFYIYDAKRYRFEIERLVERHQIKQTIFQIEQQEVPLFQFGQSKDSLSKFLAKSVRRKKYHLEPPRQRLIKVKEKKRMVYDYQPSDQIVCAVFARFLNECYRNTMSASLYSYQPGNGAHYAAQDLIKFIRQARRGNVIQGLYVLQVDIQKYAESIPLHERSNLWPRLEALLGSSLNPYEMNLIRSMIRPIYTNLKHQLQMNTYGVTTGTSISNFLYNYYGDPLDKLLDNQPGLFYARFSDDILLCHADASQLQYYEKLLYQSIEKLELSINPQKMRRIYLSPAGHAKPEHDFKGTNAIDYMGYRIDGYGKITLSERRKRKILRRLYLRIRTLTTLLKQQEMSQDLQIQTICQAVNQALIDPDFREYQVRSLILETTDHGQLKEMDYRIALCIANCVTSIRGPRAFSNLPYQTLRSTYGLCSLVQLRNNACF